MTSNKELHGNRFFHLKTFLIKTLLILAVISLSCAGDEEDEFSSNTKVLTIFKDGEFIDFSDVPEGSFPTIRAYISNNKKLLIYGELDGLILKMTVNELFLEENLTEGLYKIGTQQNNLETNIYYFDPNDTYSSPTPYNDDYLGVYGCDVLKNEKQGEIQITEIDYVNKIIIGTFYGDLFRWTDLENSELKTIGLTDGKFKIPFTESNTELDANRDLVKAKVNGFQYMSNYTNPLNAFRSTTSGIDKINIGSIDPNFGRIHIWIPADVSAGNTLNYRPDGSTQSLGVRFLNMINIPENLNSINPNQSNDSYIHIINHDPESNFIEGTFYIENSEIAGRTITDGYFKATYDDNVDD